MTKIVAKDGDRLDGIVYKHFGHLAYSAVGGIFPSVTERE